MGATRTVTGFPLSSGPDDPQNHDTATMAARERLVNGIKTLLYHYAACSVHIYAADLTPHSTHEQNIPVCSFSWPFSQRHPHRANKHGALLLFANWMYLHGDGTALRHGCDQRTDEDSQCSRHS